MLFPLLSLTFFTNITVYYTTLFSFCTVLDTKNGNLYFWARKIYSLVVKINFVDVKGNCLFQMGEKEETTMNGKEFFFSSLFDFPYPTFELCVKGYYGKKSTFELKVLNFDAQFDSSTGNYNVSVEFFRHFSH